MLMPMMHPNLAAIARAYVAKFIMDQNQHWGAFYAFFPEQGRDLNMHIETRGVAENRSLVNGINQEKIAISSNKERKESETVCTSQYRRAVTEKEESKGVTGYK